MAKKLRINSSKVVLNDHTRLFIERDVVACSDIYDYHSCVAVGDIGLPKQEETLFYCADPYTPNEFAVLARVEGAETVGSAEMATNFTTARSALRRYYNKRCPFKMQIHVGECDIPSNFSKFDKALIFSGVVVDNYSLSTAMTNTQADRAVVTESASFTFTEMLEVTKPEFVLHDSQIVAAGPIIDSFTFCGDYTCSLCEGHAGRYFVQLLTCVTEDILAGVAECNRVRIIYTKDEGGTWNVSNVLICDSLDCNQPINRNVTQDTDNFYYSSIDYGYAASVTDIIRRGKKVFPKSLLTGNEILNAYNKADTTFYVGENGRFYFERHGIIERLINGTLEISRNILSIDSIDGYDFVAGAAEGMLYYGNTNNTVTSILLPTANDINQVAAVNGCAFVTSNGANGGFLYTDGKVEKLGGIHGRITRFKFFNEDIGYATTLLRDVNYIWQTVNGGQDWQQLDTELDAAHVITTISICPTNHNLISIAGRKMNSIVTELDHVDPNKLWDCEGNGFIILSV